MSVYLTETGVSLGELAISEKTNKIPHILDFLYLIDIKDKTITADTMYCQKKAVKR